MVKLGLAYKQTLIKSDQMAGTSDRKAEDDLVHRVGKEEVKKLNITAGNNIDKKIKCQTCTHTHKEKYAFPGKKCTKCFEFGEGRYFKGAPICKQSKKAKSQKDNLDKKAAKKETKSWGVKNKETSAEEYSEDSEDELTDLCGRVSEVVAHSSQSKVKEPKVTMMVRPMGGQDYLIMKWLPDSGVY